MLSSDARPSCFTASPDSFNFKFTGQERDAESGLDFFQARYFSGPEGRFTGPDVPLNDQDPSDPQSWNLFSYARNNPLSNIDPTGTTCQTASDGKSKYDDLDGKGCAEVDIDDVLASPSDTAHATTDDVPYQLANQVALNTSGSSVSEVVTNGIEGAQAVEGIASLPSLFRSGWTYVNTWRMARRMAGVRAAGEAGATLFGFVQNTERIPSTTGKAYRVPDILDRTAKIIGEGKNYQGTTLSLTGQIKDDLAFAKQNGFKMVLYVRKSTQLSQPLQQLVNSGAITLIRK
jgi:RHS repeat-associated protein